MKQYKYNMAWLPCSEPSNLYVHRLCTSANKLRFVFQTMNVIDLVAFLPWYFMMAMGKGGSNSTAVFRVLRLLRVFRVFKLGGRYDRDGQAGEMV